MMYANRMVQVPTSRTHQVVQLLIVTSLAFSLGWAASRSGRDASSAAAPVVAPAAHSQANLDAAAMARVPYDTGWDVYDNGWAGGPAPRPETRQAPAVSRVPYEAGWALYDGGFAGGPAPRSATRPTASVRRVPYEASWQLYDGGFAGGPAAAGVARQVGGVGRVPYEAGWELYDGGWAGGPRTTPPSHSGN